jgi:hypothetical protein
MGGRGHLQLWGSCAAPAISSAREPTAVAVTAPVLSVALRGVEVPSPIVELLAQAVEPPLMIRGTETFLLVH